MKPFFICVVTVSLAVAVASVFVGCNPGSKTPVAPPPPPKVEVLAARQADVPVIREWVGTLDGSSNAAIQAQVSGYLIAQDYADGVFVKKDQVLFRLDDRTFKADVDHAQAEVGQAEAKLKKAQMDVDRYTPLAKEDAISQQELDDAVQALAAAKADFAAAKASLDDAVVKLAYTKITSPIDGVAGISTASTGELISTGRGNLAVVSTVDPIKAIFTISENEYLEFRAAAKSQGAVQENALKVPFKLVLSTGVVFDQIGHFDAADRQVDQRTGSLQMRVVFPNPQSLLRPGQFARVRATIREEKGAILVPQRAVTEMQGSYLVAVVGEDKKVTITKIEVGERFGSDWIVKSGLKPGVHIIAEGTQKARNGAVVEPVLHVPATPEAKK